MNQVSENAVRLAKKKWRSSPVIFVKPHLGRQSGVWFCVNVPRLSHSFGGTPAAAWAAKHRYGMP